MPELSADQFREHLEEFHRQLGLSVEPDALVLPSGHRLPTAQQTVALSTSGERLLHAKIPVETGHIHDLTARILHKDVPEFRITSESIRGAALRSIDFSSPHYDEPPAWYMPGSENARERDPKQFHEDIQRIIHTAKPADKWNRKWNTEDMQDWAKNRGHISVSISTEEPSGAHGDIRFYRFHTASGRLGRPEWMLRPGDR